MPEKVQKSYLKSEDTYSYIQNSELKTEVN